jgi:hypothetical protein
MLADLLVTPAILALIVGILSWNARVGLMAAAMVLFTEFAVPAYPHHEIRQHCELSDSCRAVAPPTQPGNSERTSGP